MLTSLLAVLCIAPAAVGVHACTKPVWWLHAPKTGSSFVNSVQKCQQSSARGNLPYERSKHLALSPWVNNSVLESVVAMFRQPEERLLSAHAWMKKDPTCCKMDWGWRSRDIQNNMVQAIAKGGSPNETISQYFGCMTNMILGHRGCMSGHKPEDAEVMEAIRRMRNFMFVGLLSEWELSVCLFNYITQGLRYAPPEELQNTRATEGASHTAYNVKQLPQDTADGLLYEFAKQRFWDDVETFGITRRNCNLPERPTNAPQEELPDIVV